MGSHGGSGPNGLTQHQASTLFLRVPAVDWPRVRIGEKTEFRTMPRESSRLLTAYLPTPVVAYSTGSGPFRETVHELMVLEERKHEPLFAISEDAEALAREGFESYDLFRRYWRARQRGVYRPMQKVWVWRVRRWESGDVIRQGAALLRQLYGEHLTW